MADDAAEASEAVLDALGEMLEAKRFDEVTSLVKLLLARNSELELRLARQMTNLVRNNEGISREQLVLFMDDVDEAADPERAKADEDLRAASGIDEPASDEQRRTHPPSQPPVRKALPPHLPRVENPIAVPDVERPCPVCGAERVCIGHEVTEVLELVPAKLIVRRDLREKLACDECEGELVRAPSGDKVVAAGRLGPGLVAQLLVDKYDDGLPLHRQKRRFARLGMELPVSTLADQVTWSTDLLRPLWRSAIAQVLTATVMHLDGTSLPVLDKQAKGGKRLGALWGYVGDTDVAAYLYCATAQKRGIRDGELGPEQMLALRVGYTVADASSLFDSSFKRPELIECGCNMHARRYFAKALDRGDKRAALPLAAYKKLYEIEANVRDLAPVDKLAARREQAQPVFDELMSWCTVHQPHEPPASPMGAALRYALNHRDALGRFLKAPEVPMDNGIVERLHVRAALTRKNFLFAGSDAGGDRAAIAFTILACCRLADVEPVEYLRDVLPRLSRRVRLLDVAAMLPAAWKAARVASATKT